ncbi:MAG: hypothetical protein HC824_21250 [Synechococcales cyanobacterium RM1_1_8]|nr:hypothetical protein [Synechococcales cyanobacterium RM1_1_8]
MKKYSAIAWASALALVLTACGGGEEPTDGTTGSVVDPNAPGSTTGGTTGTDAAAGDPAATTESAAAPTSAVPFGSVPEGSITSDVKIRSLAALIPSTPADARLNGAASGRPDPFAGQVIRVTPVFQIPREPGLRLLVAAPAPPTFL